MIRMLFAAAVALFVLSLPIHASAMGGVLRRVAGFCFVAALVPSLVLGLLLSEGIGVSISEHPIATTIAFIVAIAAAYAAYVIRKWLRDDPAKKQQRLLEKTPIERSRRQQDLFAFLADHQPPDGPRP